MPVPIKVNSTDVVITPLFDMQHKETLHHYRKGIRWHIQSGNGLYSMRGLVSFLKRATCTHSFDQQQKADIYCSVGLEFGFIHGGILTPERTLRQDVTTLVNFEDNQHGIDGYKAGRQWFFEEAGPDERTITDDQLIERLHELITEAPHWHDPEGAWFFSVGCLLGEMSGHLFPLTEQERQQWEAEAEGIMKEYDAAHRLDQERDAESLTAVPVRVVEYTA